MFSRFFINRPVFASVISIIIVIAGFIGLITSPIEEYPQLMPTQVVVTAQYSGADAQTIAQTVAAPLENAINGVEDMIYMQTSSSSSGVVSIVVFFKTGTDPQTAVVNVSNRVNPALSLLPEEVKRLGVRITQRSSSILEVAAFYDKSGKMDPIELSNYVSINIADAIKRVPGVGDATIVGSQDYSMRIWIKPDLLKKFNITTTDVIAAIREQNNQYPTGKIGEQPLDSLNPYVYSIKPQGRLKTVDEFKNIILRANENGGFLRLKDVANVELGASQYTFSGGINNKSMVPVLVFLQNGANALKTAKAINQKLEELSKSFPSQMTYEIPYDTTKFVEESIKEVTKTFVEAMVLVILVIYMFLGNLRATLIPMLAVPVSILGTFAGLYLIGFSINLITLFALILAIGIVVDDAIIVIENVERNLHEHPNMSVKEATQKAMGEIMAPVISIVLVLCAVFIPVTFSDGFIGMVHRQFAFTLVIAVCISGFVALTLTPALCALILQKKQSKPFWFVRKFNDFFDFSTSVFTKGVGQILKHSILSIIFVGILFFSLGELFKHVPFGLVPAEDKGYVMAITTLPPASTLPRTKQDINFIASEVLKNPNTKTVISFAGYDIMAGALRENAGLMFIKLNQWNERPGYINSSFAIANNLQGKMYFADRNSVTYFLTPPPIMGLSLTGGFEFYAQNLDGKDYNQIYADMQQVIQKANQHPALMLVRTTLDTNFPQYDLTLNMDKIKMMGVSLSDIFTTISATIGQYYVNDFNMLGKTYHVNLRATDEYRDSPKDLANLYVRGTKNGVSSMIPLDSIVTLTRSMGPDNVDRFNGFPAAKIMGQPKPGYTSGQAIEAISEIFHQTIPTGYNIGWSGASYQEVNLAGAGKTAFIFGVIFVFLILAAQYERWLMPIAVILAIPFGVFGSVLFTWARGLSNDLYFQIGLLLLIGLCAKNAILIVEFAMQERQNGKSIKEAAILAARLRFRPIVMTSLAFTLGVIPMVFATGAGAASRHSLGTGVVGGMIAATTIAIFFVPLFFMFMEKINEWIGSKKGDKNV